MEHIGIDPHKNQRQMCLLTAPEAPVSQRDAHMQVVGQACAEATRVYTNLYEEHTI
jgi:hypothetical protein